MSKDNLTNQVRRCRFETEELTRRTLYGKDAKNSEGESL